MLMSQRASRCVTPVVTLVSCVCTSGGGSSSSSSSSSLFSHLQMAPCLCMIIRLLGLLYRPTGFECMRSCIALTSRLTSQVYYDPLTRKKFSSRNTYLAATASKKYKDAVKRSGLPAPAPITSNSNQPPPPMPTGLPIYFIEDPIGLFLFLMIGSA